MNTGIETWRGFWRLNAASRSMVLEAAAVLVATWVGLRLAGFWGWRRILVWMTPGAARRASVADAAASESARATTLMEQAAARHLFFRPNCLEQSLALWWLLRRRGIAADFRIGARKQDGRFEAHAWLEFAGAVLNDVSEGHIHFVPFDGSIVSMEAQVH